MRFGIDLRTFAVVIICLQVANVHCEDYTVYLEPVNWYQALINCKKTGLELASVHTEKEEDDLERFLMTNGHASKGFWLAGTKEGNSEYYWATTGLRMIYTKWLSGQPDNIKSPENYYEGQHCVQWGGPRYITDNGWNDHTCNNSLPYVCQNFEYCPDYTL